MANTRTKPSLAMVWGQGATVLGGGGPPELEESPVL